MRRLEKDENGKEKETAGAAPPESRAPGARERVGALARSKAALESDLLQTSLELRRASEEYEALAAWSRESSEQLRAQLEATRRERDGAKQKLQEVYSSRVWRLGTVYWRLLARLGLLSAPAASLAEDPAPAAPPVPAMPPTVEAGRSFGLRRDPVVPGLPDVVCFSIVEWEFLFQRPQQLLSRLADRGHRVYYVSQFFEPVPGAPEPHRLRSRVYALRLRGSESRLFSEELPASDADSVFASLSSLREREGITSAVSVVHQPFWWPLVERAKRAFGWRVLYDCMDDHAGFQTNARPVEKAERGILQGADVVVASSRSLERRLRSAKRPVSLLPNGCDVEYFSSIAPRSRKGRPTVGYYGCIADWFDADLVADVARRRPDWDFVLIGPTYLADLTRLPALPNVSFPGIVPYGQLVERIEPFDVFILPFRRSALTEAANPVKAYEIVATGRPLVAVPLPELEPFGDLVRFASDPIELERQIDEALGEDDPGLVERRRAFARQSSWDARAAVLGQLVLSLGSRKAPVPTRPVKAP